MSRVLNFWNRKCSLLANNYPFAINLSLTNNVVNPGRTELFNIDVTWPYDSGNDALDTEWGMRAYQYLNNSHTTTCISITAEVRVNQENLETRRLGHFAGAY